MSADFRGMDAVFQGPDAVGDQYPAGDDGVEAQQQVHPRRLAYSGRSDDRHGTARFGGKGEVVDHRTTRAITEAHMVEFHTPGWPFTVGRRQWWFAVR